MDTVLIADDAPSLRLLVSATLADQFELLEAADGDEAWQLVQRYHPQIALLDVQMPGRTGVDLTKAIRADPALSSMSVIMMTGQSGEQEISEAMSAGADFYLTKPFSPQHLMDVIKHALAGQLRR